MPPRPLIIERQVRTLIVDRGGPRRFELIRGKPRELVIQRSGLPGGTAQAGDGLSLSGSLLNLDIQGLPMAPAN